MKNTNYKYIYKKTVLVTTFMFIFSVLYTTAATVKYVPLEAGAFKDFGSTDSLVGLLTSVFNFGIAIAVVSALIMIVWGGIIKMTTDSWQGQDDAKNKFENAGYGLGLALVSYVILYTINPCLVLFGEKDKCNNQLLFATPPKTAATDETTECDHCVTIDSYFAQNIKCKDGVNCRLNVDLVNKLNIALKDQNALVTEGYPPTYTEHKSPCHRDGTCTDVALTSATIPNIISLNTSLTKAGLNAWYELSSDDPTGENKKLCDSLNNAKLSSDNSKINCRLVKVTAPHFHVE